jgi:hypothetical protein
MAEVLSIWRMQRDLCWPADIPIFPREAALKALFTGPNQSPMAVLNKATAHFRRASSEFHNSTDSIHKIKRAIRLLSASLSLEGSERGVRLLFIWTL